MSEKPASYRKILHLPKRSSTYSPPPAYHASSPKSLMLKPDTASGSRTLTNSEVERLRRGKKELNDYARKAFEKNPPG